MEIICKGGRKREDEASCHSNVWDKLPFEVAERILALLPVASVLQSRCVCKKWRSLLACSSFLELWTKLSSPCSLFLVYHTSHGFAAFSPFTSRWCDLPVFTRCSLDPQQVLLMASSGGLLCFRNHYNDYLTLTVCNPVTNSCRILPPSLQIRYVDILGMVTDSTSNSYKILVTGTTESSVVHSITEIYDSNTKTWVHHCHSKRDFLQLWSEVHAIWCNESFYCLTMPTSSTQGYRLLAYDMQQQDWLDLNVQMPSSYLRCPSLLTCSGHLLLAGKIVVENAIKSICIWELQIVTLKWKEIASMPTSFLSKICIPYFLAIQCYANSNLICFSRHGGCQSVVYDLLRKTWNWIPYTKICTERKKHKLVGMSYEPSLSAKV